MSLCRVVSCVVGRGCLLWLVRFLGKTLLAFVLLHFLLQCQIFLYSRYLLTSYFCIQVPYDEKDIFFWLLVLEDLVKAMVFPVVMYGCESWPVKKAECRRIDAFELWCWRRLLRVPWTARRSNQSNLKEIDQSWVFFGRNDVKAETAVLWPPHAKSWLIGKDSDAGRDWGQEEKGMTEDEMAGGHHWLDGRESQWTPGVGDGQGGLACYDSWGCKELDTTERLIWSDLIWSRRSCRSS